MDVAEITQLLETYQERNRKIVLLRYELEHSANISPDEMIESMSLGHGSGMSQNPGHISNKTLYIALNYQEQADRLNQDTTAEISKNLVALEQVQERLNYYVSSLGYQERTAIQRFYFEGHTWDEVADELHVVQRTVYKIKKRALEQLAGLYGYTKTLT